MRICNNDHRQQFLLPLCIVTNMQNVLTASAANVRHNMLLELLTISNIYSLFCLYAVKHFKTNVLNLLRPSIENLLKPAIHYGN